MKTVRKLLIGILAMVALATTARAQNGYLQDPRYGATPEERHENALMLNYFDDARKANRYDLATSYLHKLIERNVSASQNLFINGANIYKTKISTSKSVEEKNAYVDTLMTIYDARAKHFGDNATRGRDYILAQKANDYASYRPADVENVLKLYREAIAAGG
ncbi:MAG: enzyme of heme biosynthesis, partial [Rikenellaceae bacterium]|nr:enzyme of heme biosynthesis [Rikenellaceae bacterium]